jgi:hypothetical protein
MEVFIMNAQPHNTMFEPLQQIEAGELDVGYVEGEEASHARRRCNTLRRTRSL